MFPTQEMYSSVAQDRVRTAASWTRSLNGTINSPLLVAQRDMRVIVRTAGRVTLSAPWAAEPHSGCLRR